jgi:hypothetical protein
LLQASWSVTSVALIRRISTSDAGQAISPDT